MGNLYVVEPVCEPYVVDSTSPGLTMYVRDENANLIALSGSVKFYMWDTKTKEAKIEGAAVVLDPDQVTNKGKCTYQWLSGELDTPGDWFCRLLFGTAEWSRGFHVPVVNGADSNQVRYTT